jgi:hypothetical protein
MRPHFAGYKAVRHVVRGNAQDDFLHAARLASYDSTGRTISLVIGWYYYPLHDLPSSRPGLPPAARAGAASSHRTLTEAEREQIGIREGLVRLSAGIEEVQDIREDLEQALERIGDLGIYLPDSLKEFDADTRKDRVQASADVCPAGVKRGKEHYLP